MIGTTINFSLTKLLLLSIHRFRMFTVGEDNSNTLEDKPLDVPEETAPDAAAADPLDDEDGRGGGSNSTALVSYWTDGGEQEQERVSLRNASDARGIFSQIVQTMSLGSMTQLFSEREREENHLGCLEKESLC